MRMSAIFRAKLIPLLLAVGLLMSPALFSPAAGGDVFSEFNPAEVDDVVNAVTKFSVTSAAIVADIEPGWHINSARPREDWLIPAEVSFDTTEVLIPHGLRYPEGTEALLAGMQMSVYEDRVIIPFTISVAEDAVEGDHVLPVRFTYQPCDDRQCGAPKELDLALTVKVGAEGEPLDTILFGNIEGGLDPGEVSGTVAEAEPPPGELQVLIYEYGVWGYVLALGLAFVTGLLLSFSPCTYPMIPITVSIFAGQERSFGRGFVLSLFYVGSMAVMYGVMGLIVSLVGGVFGAWLASPPVVIGIAVIFVIFSLSMFGLYELQVPSSLRQKLGATKTGGGVVGAVVLGVVAALIVSPCVGPFVAGILLYVATNGSPVIGFFVLFVFAIGLGTLYVIIGTFSSSIHKLPGSGAWMETVKRFFGFVLLIMALYFLRSILPAYLIAILTGLLLLALGIFGGGFDRLTPDSTFFPRLKKFVGILAFLVGVYLLLSTILIRGLIVPPASEWLPVGGSVTDATTKDLIPWRTDLESGLVEARTGGKPVLIDTWATWCVNCRILDERTFRNPRVAAEAERFIPIKVQLETAGSEVTRDFMKRFGLKHYSLPTTLLLDSSGRVIRMLQGVVDPEDMIEAMRTVHP
jgi:thiol:disulfide interchange protein DsbD